MNYKANSVEEYMELIPEDRRPAMKKLWETIGERIPDGFDPCINYSMPSYVVPHSLYEPGYHCDPKLPLPFLSIASQKNFIALYHMGIYANPDLLVWFTDEYPKHSKRKLDMGKSCIRFKKVDQIPFELIGDLVSRMTVEDWVGIYEDQLKR